MADQNMVVIITGASSGIGKETALRLIEDGHIVYGAARRVGHMRDLVEAGGKVLELDITDDALMEQAVNTVLTAEGRIDVLVNNAGFAVYGAVEDVAIDDARQQFEVNIFGLARLTQLILPGMRERRSGTIINVSSMGGKIYTPLGAWYHATKHALEGWSDCLRLELKSFGINVIIIEPGVIKTEFGDVLVDPLLKRSKNGAYADLAGAIAKSTHKAYSEGKGSSPRVISQVMSKAIRSRRPRLRYIAGSMARPVMFLRMALGDRLYDRMMLSQYGR